MGDVMEFDMSNNGGSRGRPPPRIASRLAAGRRSSGARSTDGPIRARPPSGRADAKATDSRVAARRPSVDSTDSVRTRERDSRRARGSSDDEAAAKSMARRRTDSPMGYGRADRNGSDAASGSDTGKYRLGQKVEGRFRGKGRWYKGRIVGVNAGGTYDVRYDDGDEDLGLDASAIRSEEARDSGRGGGNIDRRDEERRGGTEAGRAPAYRLGDRAEARAPGTNRWQRVTVVGENRNGTLDVRFRDGTEERRLDPSMVRPLEEDDGERRGNGRDSVDSMEFAEGDRVEARFGGRSRWYKATVERKNRDGTYWLIYADGDEERAVDKSLMRRIGNGGELPRSGSRSPGRRVVSGVESETGSATGKNCRVGDAVEARYKRGRKWYPGVVRRVNRDGTMDITYKDGDSERDVDPSLVRSKGGVSVDSLASSSADTGFSRGDKVEARFGGRSRWFKATVERENRDGTYHLLYVDGDEERAVEKHLIRRIEGVGSSTADGRAASRSRSPADRRARDDVAGREEFAEGERVEARFGGRSRWSRATVERKNRNGTYRLVYADGNEEREAESRLIRALGSGGDNGGSGSSPRRPSSAVADRRGASNLDSGSDVGNARKTAIRANDRIEARFKGGQNWYAGIVVAANRDGSFDVKYDDGDREYDVDARLVRSLSTGSVRDASAARERGRGGGGRAEDAADGYARARHAGASTVSLDSVPADRDFAVGDKVEARFGGRSRWFKATIERENRDGTYHLLYVDGDEERAVEKHLIRRVGASTSPTAGNRSPGRRVVSGVDSETDSAAGKAFRVGDDVEARYKRGRKWYPGVVRRVNRDGTMDITYKDGDSERDVDPSLVRSKGGISVDSLASSSADTGFSRGDKVEARFGGRSRWFKATIERENRDGTYHLLYVDGDEERAVEKHLIRRVGASTSPTAGNRSPGRRVVSGVDSETDSAAGKAFRVGDDVEARYKRGRKWYPGVVRRVNRDGSMDITYKDGDSERDVDPTLVRSKGGISVDSLASSAFNASFSRGDKVEARFGGRSRWFKATIERENRDGTYHLLYVDGDEERAVEKHLIRRVGASTSPTAGNRSPGRRVVSGVDSETDSAAGKAFRVGDEVEARYKRGRKWYPGVVRRVNRDGTMDITYKDGDSERDVDPSLVRSKGAVSVDSLATSTNTSDTARGGGGRSNDFAVGDKVEARFGGRSRWFRAAVEGKNRDGTYCLLYDDGDVERSVDKKLIRSLARPSGETKRDEKYATEASAAHRIGDEIEARYKRGRKWYPGKVRAVNANGSYDIRYLDGDSERDVEAAFVRPIGGSAAGESPGGLAVGDKVEARFRAGSRWFKATVEGKNRDGTFSLSYDDGDFETAVERDHIRKVEGDRAGGKTAESSGRGGARRGVSRTGSETGTDVDQGEERKVHDRGETRSLERRADLPRAGDDVEARLRGSSMWRLGRVARVHRDGSYDVEYGGGKSERNVPASHVRSLMKKDSRSGDSDSDRKSRYRDTTKRSQTVAIAEGDQVEARLRGGSTWHSGKVTRVHSDGTYDVRYSRDGELEKGIEPRLVRLPHYPDGTVRAGSPRTSNRGRSGGADTSSDEGSYRGTERGRRKERSPIPQETASEDAEAAATKVRRSLRHAGKTVDDLVRKLERLRRSTGGIDENTLGRVLARVGIEISTREARALRRCCPDVDNHGCVAPSALAGLVSGRNKSPIKRRRSSGSATRGGRRHASISELASDQSESESAIKGPASVARRGRVRGSSSSLDSRISSGSSGGGRLHRRHHHAKAKAAPERRSPTQRKKLDTGSGSELGGDTSSDGQGMGGALIGNKGSRALRKLGGSAFDGSLRQEFDKLNGSGRRRVLPISSLKPLLRHVRVKLEESSLAEVMVVVDPDGLGSFSLQGLLEVALSTFEDKKVSKVYSSVCEQLFKPTNGRGRKGRKESQEAEAASAAVSKMLSKLEHPKGSGLLTTGDLKKLLQRVGARVSSEDAELLAERLDPADRGKVDREGLVVWLTSGFDVTQAESRASGQLCLLKAKKKASKPEKAFREFDVDRQGEVRKTDFVLALGRLGLVLTHGQATALAAKHHGDYEGFLATLADPTRLPEGAVSERSDDSGSDTDRGPKGKSWIKNIGRRRGGSNTNSRSRSRNSSRRKGRTGRGSGGEGGSSDDGDRPLTSGSSDDGEEGEDKAEDEYDGILLGKRARVALRDAFERACSATGGVQDIFCSAAGGGHSRSNGGRDVDTASGQGALLDREQTRRFLRRLKLDAPDDDRAALLNALAPPPGTSVGDGDDGRASGEKGVSFESDGGRKKRTKPDDGGGDGLVSYRDFLELVLAEQESKEVSKIHGRMSKDLARAADRSRGSKQSACPFALVVKALSKQDAEGLGYIKASDFKRSLERLGFGGLSAAEKSLLVRRFDPVEEGTITYEVFAAWLSSGLDPDRLTVKLGRLLGQLTGRQTRSGGEKKKGKTADNNGARDRAIKKRLPGGVRGLFEGFDEDGVGTVSRHDMKVVLRRTLGLPLTEGDLRAIFARLDKDGDGMLDYEELLALASKRDRGGARSGIKRSGSGILSKLKDKGSAIVKGGASGKSSKRHGGDGSSQERDSETDASKDEDSKGGDAEMEGRGRKKKHLKDKKKEKKKEKKKSKEEKEKAKNNQGRGSSDRDRVGRRTGTVKGARLESRLMGLRVSIIQQSAAAAAAAAAEERGNEDGKQDDGGGGGERSGISSSSSSTATFSSPAAVTAKWTAMFESRDRAGTGKATVEDLRAVFEEGDVKMSEEDVTILMSKFAVPSGKGGRAQADEREEGDSEVSSSSPAAAAMDYDAFVRWLSEGGGLDDALLGKVQRHLKARLSKAMDLRALFTEMCDDSSSSGGGGGGGGGRDKRHSTSNEKRGTETTLSTSSLARGLRHAGLPLDRGLVSLLVAAFSTSGGGGGRRSGRGRHRHHPVLSYADFHRMVNCEGLLKGASAVLGARGGGQSGTLDEQIRSSLLETVERAFAFYDQDNSNSIDATEVVSILRALGHDPTRGESRALLRKANVDRNGGVEFDGFQEAVMPFLLERTKSKKLTEGEMRAMFDEIDTNRSGSIKRKEFSYLFCSKLRLLSHEEAEALLGILDRHQSGQVSWVEFVKLFELVGDETGSGGIAALPADMKEVVAVALRKLQMGAMPDVEGQLSSFLGMPSSCRKSVLAPLDNIKELSLQWVLMPKLDSRGCIQLQDMSVKVTTEVAEVEASKAPPDAQGQVLVKTANLADRGSGSGSNSNKKSPSKSLAATLGFGRRDREKSPPPAITESKGTKTRRRSSILGAGLMETTTTVMKRATLQEVGASTEEGGGGGGGRRDGSGGGGGVMQVELSVKHAFGIPVARDSKMGDIRQRGMRACLFYDAGRDVDRDTGEASSEYNEHFLCNTYKTLAIQHPQKEEQWLFPDSSEGERKFLVRTDFGSSSGNSSSSRQGTRDTNPSSAHSRGDRKRLFLLVELTCTVQTAKDEATPAKMDGGGVRGPLKNFRAGSSSTAGGRRGKSRGRVGGIREKRGGGEDSNSGEGGSGNEYSDGGSQGEGSVTASATSSDTGSNSDSSSSSSNAQKNRKARGRRKAPGGNRRENKTSSAPPPRRGGGRRSGHRRNGVRSEGPGGKRRRQGRHAGRSSSSSSGGSDGESNDGDSSHSGESDSSFSGRKRGGKKAGNGGGTGRALRGSDGGGRGGGGEGRSGGPRRRGSDSSQAAEGGRDDGDGTVEVEMSCGWVLIPFLELVESHEVKKVRYKLLGGTPFAKTDINEDEVMTRRYGWRAVLKAMKIEGLHKGSEVEIKILPVNALSKAKQEDIFRLPRNVILSDTFVSLVRHYREYAANSLAKRSARGMGNVGFGAGSASSEPVLALFPRLAGDPALMMALKNQWETEMRKTHVDGRLGATISNKLAGLAMGGGGGGLGGGLVGVTGAAREARLLSAFEKAVLRLWPAFCHIDAQRGRASGGNIGAESYEELESRGQRIRQILDSTDSFHSDTPTKAANRGEGGRRGNGGGSAFSSAVSQEGRVMVAFTLKEVAFDVA